MGSEGRITDIRECSSHDPNINNDIDWTQIGINHRTDNIGESLSHVPTPCGSSHIVNTDPTSKGEAKVVRKNSSRVNMGNVLLALSNVHGGGHASNEVLLLPSVF